MFEFLPYWCYSEKNIYTVCRFSTNSSFKPQFEAIEYTTNQTYKLFSISKIVFIGTTRINFLLLIDHYWGAWCTGAHETRLWPEWISKRIFKLPDCAKFLNHKSHIARFHQHEWSHAFKCMRLCICHETFSHPEKKIS
jgi:hypothetical protein